MRTLLLNWLVVATALGVSGAGPSGGEVTVTVADERVDVKVDGKLFTTLHTGSEARNNGDSYTVDRPVGLERNSFRGPAQVNVDLAASQSFRLPRTLRAEARVEVFNLLNRDNFIRVNNIYGEGPSPLSTFLAPVAGITNADPARQVQFLVRMLF